MRHSVAPGDALEFEYVRTLPPSDAAPGGFSSDRFYFRGFEVPYDRSEYVVVVPREMELTVDPRGPAPTLARAERGGLIEYRWMVRQSDRMTPEPRSVMAREFIPSIAAGFGATWERLVAALVLGGHAREGQRGEVRVGVAAARPLEGVAGASAGLHRRHKRIGLRDRPPRDEGAGGGGVPGEGTQELSRCDGVPTREGELREDVPVEGPDARAPRGACAPRDDRAVEGAHVVAHAPRPIEEGLVARVVEGPRALPSGLLQRREVLGAAPTITCTATALRDE